MRNRRNSRVDCCYDCKEMMMMMNLLVVVVFYQDKCIRSAL